MILLLCSLALGACRKAVVLDPSGDVAAQQRDILLFSTWLMLLIIVPVMAATVAFAWHYRQSNTKARYEPDWDHSTKLELMIWSAPLLIIICLGAITWLGTHLLDPYRKLGRIDENRPVAADVRPLEVDVVALDWKWLFIYPEYGIASVNAMAAPVDRPIDFRITASTVMNSFYIPALAGQIYAMPGMETRLAAVINEAGDYEGFSANYSGAGFSRMKFVFHALDGAGFDGWVAQAKSGGGRLGRDEYLDLRKPSEADPARAFGEVDPDLYHLILNMCVEPGKMCMHQMAMIDAQGGMGMAGVYNVAPLAYDGRIMRTAFGPLKTYVSMICTPGRPMTADGAYPALGFPRILADAAPLAGAGLRQPPTVFGQRYEH